MSAQLSTIVPSSEEAGKATLRTIAESIQEFEGYENVWKLILIAATIQDGEASESRQTAVEVLEAIEELRNRLPVRTFIVVLRTSGNGIWSDATHSHAVAEESSIYPKLITLCALVFCVLLAAMVLFFVCRKPRRTDDIKKSALPFGASLSSIKFIDEDPV
ncbi:hypothetical protein TELCIR_04611 [Teladorsagia circumcincta]|uniref:Uncharacterized protein n=1 Tax=Teladorsagia circumcincta TaxID=45464 RepID=A0A2G9UVA4_TELCI|nr:hypothetical protein TELCIR_04611 [Teladorsagia circumcincta]